MAQPTYRIEGEADAGQAVFIDRHPGRTPLVWFGHDGILSREQREGLARAVKKVGRNKDGDLQDALDALAFEGFRCTVR